jgi:hypothetical protein
VLKTKTEEARNTVAQQGSIDAQPKHEDLKRKLWYEQFVDVAVTIQTNQR